jgi:adenylyltransferase/sulfurtransferase
MDKSQLNRYSRQIQLSEIGLQGQQTLLQSKVLIIGMGGLGSPVAAYLAAAGIGQLTLVDFDVVDLSNLQRQILHGTADIDKPKVESAVESLRAINPDIRIEPINYSLEGGELLNAVNQADAVVDCCDNFATRFELNEACVKTQTPLISGGVIQFEGQVTVFDSRQADSPCYQCLYKPMREGEGETCSQVGVLASAPGIIGSIQATETLKLLLGLPTLRGRLLLMDAKSMEWRVIQLPKDPLCPICQA